MNQSEKKYRLSESVVFSNIGEEAVILDPKKGSYFGLSDVGVLVWEQMSAAPKSVGELCQSVCEVFDVETQECETDLKELIGQLEKAGLVVEV